VLVMLIVILIGVAVAIVAGTVLAGVAFYDVAFVGAGAAQLKSCGCTGCGGCSQRTTKEALAIAALVQRSLPRSEVERIRNWTQSHVRVVADKTLCPMMGDDGACMVFASPSPVETVL
jgi:hypothetical protein